MRQTVAVGVIKATTPKVAEGKQTKAAEKAMKKKWTVEEGQLESPPSAHQPSQQQPWSIFSFNTFSPKICLYFHRKEFRRIDLSCVAPPPWFKIYSVSNILLINL